MEINGTDFIDDESQDLVIKDDEDGLLDNESQVLVVKDDEDGLLDNESQVLTNEDDEANHKDNERIADVWYPISYDNPIDAFFLPLYREIEAEAQYRDIVRNHYYAWRDEFISVLEHSRSKCMYSFDEENIDRLEELLPVFEEALSLVMHVEISNVYDEDPDGYRRSRPDDRGTFIDYYRLLCQMIIYRSEDYEYQDKIYEFQE